ncbi:ABC transporter permease [Pararhodobacter zhoushanensis]|uniref:ABC transporter permease n=1 Tax=Pararhodobacter zhoushanensis TaxID=2479545 RepID=UPI003CCC5359
MTSTDLPNAAPEAARITALREMGARRFGRFNWLGTLTLAKREIMRFLAVWQQTVAAPLVTAGLFLGVFSLAMSGRAPVMGVPFLHFLVPGILMMSVIQNAFANTSSSIVGAKVMGNIVDTLMPPLSPAEIVAGYLAGGIARGLLVSVVIVLAVGFVLGVWPAHPVWLLAITITGGGLLGGLGLVAGILANKFDQIAAFTNFVVTPLSFLSGTFYSSASMPPAMAAASHLNPFFYLIDGARFAYLGTSDTNPVLGLGVTFAAALALAVLAWIWITRGFRLKA